MIPAAAVWMWIKKLPREVWYVLGAVILLAGLWFWHTDKVSDAYKAGAVAQKMVDEAAFTKAAVKAEVIQDKKINDLKAKQAVISKEKNDELTEAHSDIARLAAQLRLRQAQRRAGLSGDGKAAAVSDATAGIDDTACTAVGGLSFDTAILMAIDAEHDAATLRSLQAWVNEQQKAWPHD